MVSSGACFGRLGWNSYIATQYHVAMYTRENEKSCGREKSRRVRVCATSTDEPSLGLSTTADEFRSCTLIVLSSCLSLVSIVGEVEIVG